MHGMILIACASLAACWRDSAGPPPSRPAPAVAPVAAGTRTVEDAPDFETRLARLVEEGDAAFARADLATSEDRYRRVLFFPTAKVGDYARFKLAWVHINNGKGQEALELFTMVARYARDTRLRKAAGDDATHAYASVGRANAARAFFDHLDPARTDVRLGLLADAYDMMGKPAEAAIVRAQLTP